MSGPVAFCGLLFCNNFLTPSSVTMMLSMSRNGVPSGSRVSEVGSYRVYVERYWRLRILVLSIGEVNSRPLSFSGAIPDESLRRDLM